SGRTASPPARSPRSSRAGRPRSSPPSASCAGTAVPWPPPRAKGAGSTPVPSARPSWTSSTAVQRTHTAGSPDWPDAPAAPDTTRRMRPELIATDLDGTLLRSDGTASPRSADALRADSDAGIETVLVTARPPRWLDERGHIVGDHGIALCGNGAFRYDVAGRRVFGERTIDPVVVAEIVTDLREQIPGTGFAAERSTGLAAENMFAAIHDHPEDLVTTSDIELLRDAPAGKLLARNPHLTDEEFIAAATEVVGE